MRALEFICELQELDRPFNGGGVRRIHFWTLVRAFLTQKQTDPSK